MILNFGKHSGKQLRDCPRDYIEWLAGAGVSRQNASVEAQKYLASVRGFERASYTRTSDTEIEAANQTEEIEREYAQREQEAFDQDHTLSWTANSGQKIAVSVNDEQFDISVNGSHSRAFQIVPVRNVPGIVAKVGQVGLTAERRDALLAMMER